MRVGVFDSGVGGLTVVKSLLTSKIFKEIIYFGDTARVPYGNKDANTVIRYSLEALEFFTNFEIDLMIVACNSATAYALKELKKRANIPVFGVIEPGVLALKSQNLSKKDHILVIGTSATITSKHYQRGIKKLGYENITAIATPLFVPLVEEGIKNQTILKPVFDYYFKNIPLPKAVILGCTHFPLLQSELQDYFKDAFLIHSGNAIVEYLKTQKDIIDKQNEQTSLKLFSSENANRLKLVAQEWLKV
jgi:glutamate racemase